MKYQSAIEKCNLNNNQKIILDEILKTKPNLKLLTIEAIAFGVLKNIPSNDIIMELNCTEDPMILLEKFDIH